MSRVQSALTTISRRGIARVRRANGALSDVDRSLLSHIGAHPGCRAVDIAAHFQLSRSTVSRQLGALMELGCVTTGGQPEGASSLGRSQGLHLTAAGQDILSEAGRILRAALAERLADWSAEDIEDFARMLERYTRDTWS